MAQRILVFESDTEFAKSVELNFTNLGADVEVVSDGNKGLERASQHRPDLILLSIELPTMNGFLVCKKIKKSVQLKDIPLVILSSDANADEIFEQHKKLRTRAEEYIRKPVAFADLLAKVRGFVNLSASAAVAPPPLRRPNPPQAANVDAEIDAFAESAFDSLVMSDDAEATTVGEVPLHAAVRAATNEAPRISEPSLDVDLVMSDSDPPTSSDGTVVEPLAAHGRAPSSPPAESHPPSAHPPSVRPPSIHPQVPPPPSAPVQARAPDPPARVPPVPRVTEAPPGWVPPDQVRALRERLEEAEHHARRATGLERDVERLEKLVSELKTKAEKGGGVSSREFLDQREALYKKEKEILDLKDQIGARDKQLLELNERNLGLERGRTDFEEKLLDLERKLIDAEEKISALGQDKESANKRADDLKNRLERTETKAKRLEEELDTEKAGRAQEFQALRDEQEQAAQAAEEKLAEMRARLSATHAGELESLNERHAKETADAHTAHRAEIDRMREEHRSTSQQAAARHAAELQAESERHAAELATKVSELSDERDATVARLRAELTSEQETLLEEAEQRRVSELRAAEEVKATALGELRRELEEANAKSSKEQNDRHSRELAVLGRKLTETENKLADSIHRFEAAEAERLRLIGELADRSKSLDETRSMLDEAKNMIGSLEAIKRSNEAALAELETRRHGLDEELGRAREKIANDDEMLERARRALAIGLGLLEDQAKNRIDAAE